MTILKTKKGHEVMKIKGTPFLVRSLPYGDDGKMRQHAVIGCCGCSNTGKYAYTGTLNPEKIKKHFEMQDWDISGGNALCPVCIAKNKAARKGESPGAKFTIAPPTMTTTMTPAMTPAMIAANAVFAKTETAATPATSVNAILEQESNMPAAPSYTPASPQKEVTVANRAAMRKIMAAGYNEELGRYENGISDASIAEELNIPVQWVIDFREVAFGPLKSNKELDAIQDDLDYIRKEVKAIEDRYLSELKACKQLIHNADERISELSKKAGFK